MTKVEHLEELYRNIHCNSQFVTEIDQKKVKPQFAGGINNVSTNMIDISYPQQTKEKQVYSLEFMSLKSETFKRSFSVGDKLEELIEIFPCGENNEMRYNILPNEVYFEHVPNKITKPAKKHNKHGIDVNGLERTFNRIITSDVRPHLNVTFNHFKLCPEIIFALIEKGWKWPSPIQEETIPKIMNGNNMIARSKNGTGKTGAYAISLLNNVNIEKKVQVIILVPTRELAFQTANVCVSIAKYRIGLYVMVATGGTSLTEDIYRINNKIEQVQVIVGSPKRVLDLLLSNEIGRKDVSAIVFDEADKLLSIEFQDIIKEILFTLPKICQKLLFSATFPVDLKYFVEIYMAGSVKCNLMNELTLKGVAQYYAYVTEEQKVSCLRYLLDKLEVKQSFIFCNSTKRVELLAKRIIDMGYSCYYIHSKLNQFVRNKAFHDFRSGHVTNLVCTDIMTRGIDVPLVNVVFNFDFPRYAESYLHRIGRCGRFGHLAIAVNFITDFDKVHFLDIEKQLECKISAIPINIDKRLYVPSYQMNDKFEKLLMDDI